MWIRPRPRCSKGPGCPLRVGVFPTVPAQRLWPEGDCACPLAEERTVYVTRSIVRSVGPASGFINTACWWSSVPVQEIGLTKPHVAPNTRLGPGADGLGTHLGLETAALKFLFVPGLPGASPPPSRAGVEGW